MSLETGLPLVLIRKAAKEYGTSRVVEGELHTGERVTVIEDVFTSGGEAARSIEKLRGLEVNVIHLIGVLDREEGAAAKFAEMGVPFTPLFKRSELPIPTE